MSKKATERTLSRTTAKYRGSPSRSSQPERGLNTTVETRELLECLRLLDVIHASQTRAEQVLLGRQQNSWVNTGSGKRPSV
jgi:hypothetical protein